MNDLVYTLNPAKSSSEELLKKLNSHHNIRFVSLVAVDLGNNHTDVKIPIKHLLNDWHAFLKNGIQTDGSSVHLPLIASINNAKVDLIPDTSVKWIVDYNWDNLDPISRLPIGTVCIPAFLKHDNRYVGSRAILKETVDYFKSELMTILANNHQLVDQLAVEQLDDITSIVLTVATELEFWVKTPDYTTDIEKLSTSQSLKEQYWKRTVGPVRTALEKAISALECYGLQPEMGHKEVGGVPAQLKKANDYGHIMEQLEIDWKYDSALQAIDNELFARDIISDTFVKEGLEVTFRAKPIEGVAGSGEHHHLGVAARLKNGRALNLFSPVDMTKSYMNTLGYGAFMGILNHYELINPFIANSNDAFNRLKPGFEAPVCVVGSLGHSVAEPSRNRTVLMGLVRDMAEPLATRFELRSPNPTSNSYLLVAACYHAMLDGIKYAISQNKSVQALDAELAKQPGADSDYLDAARQYRCEKDIFEDFSERQRDELFSAAPRNVYQNISNFENKKAALSVLTAGNIFTDKIIDAYKQTLLDQWVTEISGRLIPQVIDIVRQCRIRHHDSDGIDELDIIRWQKIANYRLRLMKDTVENNSLFTDINRAIAEKDYQKVSALQIEIQQCVSELRALYREYLQNFFIVEQQA